MSWGVKTGAPVLHIATPLREAQSGFAQLEARDLRIEDAVLPTYAGAVNEFQPLIDQLYREQVDDARKQSMEQRFVGSLELAQFVFEFGRGMVRGQLPQATEAEIEAEWQRRLRITRRLDEHGMYAPIETPS